jgi:hypothetical protein
MTSLEGRTVYIKTLVLERYIFQLHSPLCFGSKRIKINCKPVHREIFTYKSLISKLQVTVLRTKNCKGSWKCCPCGFTQLTAHLVNNYCTRSKFQACKESALIRLIPSPVSWNTAAYMAFLTQNHKYKVKVEVRRPFRPQLENEAFKDNVCTDISRCTCAQTKFLKWCCVFQKHSLCVRVCMRVKVRKSWSGLVTLHRGAFGWQEV